MTKMTILVIMEKYFWIFLVIFLFDIKKIGAQISENSPPIMHLDRDWKIQSSENIGTVVTRVSAHDGENDRLLFGLEPSFGVQPKRPLPFRIDQDSGVVYVNESLKNWAGERFGLRVTLSDGEFTVKNEVVVHILNGTQTNVNLSKYRPTFYSPPPTDIGRYPPPILPNIVPIRRPIMLKPVEPVKNYTVPVNASSKEEEDDDAEENNSVLQPSSTIKAPSMNLAGESPVRSPPDLPTAVVPIVSVCVVFLAILIAAILFRKRIYFGKTKGTKEDMAKESNGEIVLHEDPTITAQNWRGPRAFSNRYEPWDPDNNYHQDQKTDKWEFPRHRLKIFNILGEGAFGQVWKSEALDIDGKDGLTVVAVKTLKENATEKDRSDLLSELEVMKSLEPHPNIVRLLGCCSEKEPVFLIMEYVSGGKLQSFLRNSRAERYYGNTYGKSKTLTSKQLTTFVYHVAKGMDYLSSKGIIHRDLAARNILITTEDHVCKVADFGFARDIVASNVYERKGEGGRLPIRWMAPEALYDNIFTVQSDVWSFGVLIWEVVTLGSTPYPGLSAADVMRKVRDGHRLDKPEHCRRELYNIMYYCWDNEPKERPTFSELVELLEKLLLTETDYIELERFPEHCYYNILSLSDEKL